MKIIGYWMCLLDA